MDLNRVEWSRAQDLLLQLVQILSPLAERDSPVSFFLNKRFFIPPALGADDGAFSRFRHPIRLLPTLHSVQKQVDEMLGETFGTRAPQSDETVQQPESQQRKSEILVKKEPDPLDKKEGSPESQTSEEKSYLALPRQAKKLIDQVQDAISKLCHSTNLKDPKEEPLREALRRLKPNLDRIIEVVTREGMHSANDGFSPYRFALPRSPRENLLKKLISFPESNSTRPKEIKKIHDNPMPSPFPEKSKAIAAKGERPTLSNLAQVPLPPPILSEKKQTLQKEQEHRPIERTTLPAAPFVSITRQLTPARKKKKRKGFWFRDAEEERNNS